MSLFKWSLLECLLETMMHFGSGSFHISEWSAVLRVKWPLWPGGEVWRPSVTESAAECIHSMTVDWFLRGKHVISMLSTWNAKYFGSTHVFLIVLSHNRSYNIIVVFIDKEMSLYHTVRIMPGIWIKVNILLKYVLTRSGGKWYLRRKSQDSPAVNFR